MPKIMTVLFLLFMGLCKTAWAERTVTFATNADFPPMEFVDRDDRITGYAVDYMQAAGMLAGFRAEFTKVAWADLESGLQDGQYDAICSSTSITEERKLHFDFSEPYYTISQALLVRYRYKMPGPGNLTEMRIGVQAGSTGDTLAQTLENITVKPYDDIKNGIDDLLAKRLEGVLCDDPVAYYYASTKFNRLLQVNEFPEIRTSEDYGIVVRKGSQELLDLINKGIAAVKTRGIDRELQLKWTGR